MDKTDREIRDLNHLLAAARQDQGHMPDALTERILADANSVQAEWHAQPGTASSRQHNRFWPQIRSVLGGWPGLGGMVAACSVGLWIGISPPGFAPDPVGLVTAQLVDVDLFDGYDIALSLGQE
jgi:hypothetical protein